MEPNNYMTDIDTAEVDYISRWKLNAKQHFDDGDYQWLCDFLRNHITVDKGIVEIGCGAGYSTLSYAKNNFNLVALDVNKQALDATYNLLEEHKIKDRVVLAQGDVVHQTDEIAAFLRNNSFPTSVVLLCNPGGNVSSEITKTEYALLRRFGFPEDELIDNNTNLLHKWALIYATCLLSIITDRVLVVVERGDQEELEATLEWIQIDTGVRRIASELRKIRPEPQGGIPLGNKGVEQFWGAAIYYPR